MRRKRKRKTMIRMRRKKKRKTRIRRIRNINRSGWLVGWPLSFWMEENEDKKGWLVG